MIPPPDLAVSLTAPPDQPALDELIQRLLEQLKMRQVAPVAQTNLAYHPSLKYQEHSVSAQNLAETRDEIMVQFDLGTSHYALIRTQNAPERRSILSPREHEITRLVACGLPNKVIGDMLEISPWTVATYLRRIFVKLGVSSRAAMVARVIEEKFW
jgi:two-component system, NarL family, nitrate/nitrite response regulator NarL